MIKRILIGAGIAFLGKYFVQALNPAELLDISFDSIHRAQTTVFETTFKVKLKIKNRNPYPIQIAKISGYLIAGPVTVPVSRDIMFALESGQTLKPGFDLKINSGDFLLQLSQIIRQPIPALRFSGSITGGIEGKTIMVPINVEIPVL